MRKSIAILTTTALAGALSLSAASAVELTVAHGFPDAHAQSSHGIQPWMACVEERSAGDISFRHFPAGQLISHAGAMDALNSGVTDVGGVVIGYASDKMPLTGVILLPGMGTTATEMNEAWRAAVNEGGPLADEFAQNGLHLVIFTMLPAYQMMSTIGPLDTLEKFKGVKIRVSGGSTTLMVEALGGSPVEITVADLYVAMQRKTIDATSLTPASAETYGMPELVNAISANGSFGGGGTSFVINQKIYDGLTDEQRKIIDDCGQEVESALSAFVDQANEDLKVKLAGMGIDIYTISDEDLARINEAMSAATDTYVSRLAERGLPAQAAVDQYTKALGR